MVRLRFLASALAVTSPLAVAHPATSQAPAQPYQPQMAPAATPDADALADAMRQLGANPRDLTALIAAGELSLKVGDASGAAALFKRAEQVDPMNGRVKAGMARILVTQERPGEALRYFDQAVGYGLDPRTFAGDRGLAYDLIGQQERAQRDYRLALKGGDNDEVRRRYALSLAISGNQLAAFEQLEPLTRRNDRAAWRARAFVLAMTGDVAGANRIAQGMMPPGMALGLAPFFTRLPTLAPTDKAFAVHFGEVGPTPQRLADARLTPVLVALGPDPDARPAIVVPSPPPQNPRGKRGRRRGETTRVEVASATSRPTTPAPGFGAAGQSPTDPVRSSVATAPVRTAAASPPVAVRVAPASKSAPAPVRFARDDVDPIQKATLADYARVERYNQALARRREQLERSRAAPTVSSTVAASPPASTTAAPTPAAPTQLAAVEPTPRALAPAPIRPAPAPTQIAQAATLPASSPAPSPAVPGSTAGTQVVATPSPTSTSSPGSAAQVAATPSTTPTPLAASETTILARIVQGLTIPGAELGVAAPPAPTPVPAAAPAVAANTAPSPAATPPGPKPIAREPVASAAAKSPAPARPAAIDAKPAAARTRGAPVEVAEATAPSTRRGARSQPAADEAPVAAARSGRRGATTRTAAAEDTADAPPTRSRSGKRTAAETRTAAKDDADNATPARGKRGGRVVAAKDDDAPPPKGKSRTAATRTAAADKDQKEPKAAAEPSRIWVQVAGGANEGDLGKAYSAVQSRTPALRGRQAYSTPLRATNRVVTGPFKTDAEARAFVNQLAKQGVSAFPFTSDKGQKMTKLPPK